MIPTILAAATEADLPVWEDLAKTFHIKWPFFIAQLVNFFLVLFVLKKFAFGPIQEMLEKRRARIAEGEEKLTQIEQQLAESEKHTEELIAKANADSQRMIDEAGDDAELVIFPEGNHVCDNIPFKARPLMADWMAAKLAR